MDGITSPLWNDFLKAIKQAKVDLGDPEVLWYRGHPNSSFYLLATLLRYSNGLEKEKLLFTSFRKFSNRILKRRDISAQETRVVFSGEDLSLPWCGD